jgi:pimeloyl-ACP methyl ester carboxylesterase
MMINMNTNTAIETTHTVQSLDGTMISYLTVGSGPAVLVIPGALSLATNYATFAHALAEHFTVHTIERRGRGLSGPQGADYSIVKECEDVLAIQQKTGASLLVGHSFGGLVALEVARNNSTFTKVAVYEPGVSIDGSIPTNWMPGYEQKLAEKKDMDAFIEFIKSTGPRAARRVPSWYMKLLMPIILGSHEQKTILSLLLENLREHKEVARLNNSYENYRQISAGVLLMHGGKAYAPQADSRMKRLAAVFSHSETREFPKLDHFGIDKGNPREVARVVSEYFLKEQNAL